MNKNNMKAVASRTTRNGFTLIELLVVIAIIAILAAILFPVFARARENARRSSCASQMKQIGLGIMQYNQDYDERMPNMYFNSSPQVWWQGMLQPYVKNWAIFKCPSNPDVLTVTTDGVGYRNHYSPNLLCNNNNNIIFSTVGQNAGAWQGGGGTGQPLSIFDNPSTTISIFELHNYNSYSTPDSASFTANPTFSGLYSGHLGTSNYLFVDGHVKAMRPLATITPGKNLWTRDNSDTGPTSSLRCSYTQLTLFLQAAENTFN